MPLAESPNITDWLQAIGSLLALPAVGVSILLLLHERRIRHEEEHDQEAAQARLVIGRTTNLIYNKALSGSERATYLVTWSVHNYSGQPAMFVNALVHDELDGEDYLFHILWDILPPGAEVSGEAAVTVASDDEVDQSRFRVDLMFTDAAGRVWRRAGQEMPRRLRQHPDHGWIKESPPPRNAWLRALARIRRPKLQRYGPRRDGRDPFYLREE